MQSASCFSILPEVPNLWNVHFVILKHWGRCECYLCSRAECKVHHVSQCCPRHQTCEMCTLSSWNIALVLCMHLYSTGESEILHLYYSCICTQQENLKYCICIIHVFVLNRRNLKYSIIIMHVFVLNRRNLKYCISTMHVFVLNRRIWKIALVLCMYLYSTGKIWNIALVACMYLNSTGGSEILH
jgi:hypothetical protein